MFKNVFSFDGRITRKEYIYSLIISMLGRIIGSIIILLIVGEEVFKNDKDITLLIDLPFIIFLWLQAVKRTHDVGNPWYFLIIPFYFIFIVFQDSEKGPNKYGENPKGILADPTGMITQK